MLNRFSLSRRKLCPQLQKALLLASQIDGVLVLKELRKGDAKAGTDFFNGRQIRL